MLTIVCVIGMKFNRCPSSQTILTEQARWDTNISQAARTSRTTVTTAATVGAHIYLVSTVLRASPCTKCLTMISQYYCQLRLLRHRENMLKVTQSTCAGVWTLNTRSLVPEPMPLTSTKWALILTPVFYLNPKNWPILGRLCLSPLVYLLTLFRLMSFFSTSM